MEQAVRGITATLVCILAGCLQGGIVIDPFLGSGTTAVCALTLYRHYIGMELNPDYAALAESRIKKLNFKLKV